MCILSRERQPLRDGKGFVDTGDLLVPPALAVTTLPDCGGRYHQCRRLKVHPEEVEAVINRHPQVSMSLVRMKKSPITGAIVIADVVLKTPRSVPEGAANVQRDIMQFCRGELALHKVPASIDFVPALAVAETGKLSRRYA